MFAILLGVSMLALGYCTQKKILTLFITYYDPKLTNEQMEEIEVQRQSFSQKSLYIMGAVSAVSGICQFMGYLIFKDLLMAVYLFLLIRFIGKTFLQKDAKKGPGKVCTIAAVLVSLLYFATTFTYSFGPNSFKVTDEALTISGPSQTEIALTDIQLLEEVERIPERKEAAGQVAEFNGTYRGKYHLKGGETAVLYDNGGAKSLRITTKDGMLYYINGGNDDTTDQLYDQLTEQLSEK